MSTPQLETLDDGTIAAGLELYHQGLHRKILSLLEPFGPLRDFRGTKSLIFAGRVAQNLGAPRLGKLLHIRAWRSDKSALAARCYWVATRLERGPLAAWRTLRELEKTPASNPEPDHLNYLFTLRARIAWSFRDFEQAKLELDRAEEVAPGLPWTKIEKAHCLEAQDRYDEALALARQAIADRPWYRPGIQSLAHLLQLSDGDEEALDLLRKAAARMENIPVLTQLAALELNLEKWSDAGETLASIDSISPILEKDVRQWLHSSQARVSHGLGDWKSAAAHARSIQKDQFWQDFADRAENPDSPKRRVRLAVRFVRQHHMTCAPATLSAISHYWQQPTEHLELAEEICYDGTPAHSERQWAETHGWVVREFTVTLAAAKALLDRNIPFTLTTTEATSGHLQACIGYDELRQTLIVRDPFSYFATEAVAQPFLERYAAHGPRGMAMVPSDKSSLLDGLQLPDSDLHDLLHDLNRALHKHDRTAAESALKAMVEVNPGHRLTLCGKRTLAAYDANTPAILAAIEELLAQFPHDPNLNISKLSCLRELGRRDERLDYLRKLASTASPEPVFCQALSDELRADAREHVESRRWIERALRYRLDAYSLATLADLQWASQEFDEALLLYRFAACVDDKREPASRTYFLAGRARKQTDSVLEFLKQRIRRLGTRSAGPAMTLFEALELIDRTQEGLAVLDAAVAQRPDDVDLLLYRANARSRHGQAIDTNRLIQSVGSSARRSTLLRTLAETALTAGDRQQALSLWQEILCLEPLAMDAYENAARLIGELKGRSETLRYLAETRARFPQHYGLHRLSIAWLRQESPHSAEPVARNLVGIHPADSWARRELASILYDSERPKEALAESNEAIRLEPDNSSGWTMRAYIQLRLGDRGAAKADFEQALQVAVDTAPAIHGLVDLASTADERRKALKFIETELERQIVFGDALTAFRIESNRHLEPESTLASLNTALKARPDLYPAWSAVVCQLTDMQRLDEALALAEKAAERFSLLPNAWMDLARVRRAQLRMQEEIAALQKAAEAAPKWAEPCWRLGQALERAGDFPGAKKAFLNGVARQPFTAASHALLALRMWNDGEKDEALAKLKHSLDIDPGYDWAWELFIDFSRQLGHMQTAQNLARDLTVRLPGQPRPWVTLANTLFAEQKFDEAIDALDRAIQYHPRFADAHDLRATLLSRMQRWPEALAACRPEAFAGAIPVELRGRAAWVEDESGHHQSAIESMRQVLYENPGYLWGWQLLADWHYRAKDFDNAVHAATQIARLQPFSAMPLGYRAELKFHRNDRAGAKKDLAHAFKLDPSYLFAGTHLFALQLEDDELADAMATLDNLRKHHLPEEALSREVRFLAKALQKESAIPPIVWSRYPSPAEAAKNALKKLCLLPAADSGHLENAVAALFEAQRYQIVDSTLEEAVRMEAVHPHVGSMWAERRWKKGKHSCDGDMKKLVKAGEPGRRALIRLLELLADNGNKLRFRWYVWRHRNWLQAHEQGWPAVAYAYNQFGNTKAVVKWCHDWRSRPSVKTADLLHLKIALSNLGRDDEAMEVVRKAESLPSDHTTGIFKLHSALGFALAGSTREARERLLRVNIEALPEYYALVKALVDGLLRVQSAESQLRKSAFKEARHEIRTAFLKFNISRCDQSLRGLYRRTFNRMGQDAGVRWPVWREYLRVFGI